MLNLDKFSIGFLQDVKAFLHECRDSGFDTMHDLDRIIDNKVSVFNSERLLTQEKKMEINLPCPSCGRGNLVKVTGIADDIWLCRECRYSEYKG